MRKHTDAKVLNSNDPRTGSSTGGAVGQGPHEPGIPGAADDADTEDADKVESDETVKDELGNTGDGAPRVHNLAGGQGDHVGTGNGESSIDDNLPPAEEPPSVALRQVRVYVVAIAPVPEAVDVVLRVPAGHGDDGEDDEAEQQDDLCGRHDELALAIPLYGHDVEHDAQDHGHGDPDGRVDVLAPVLHYGGDGGVFGADQHQAGEEVGPAHGKAEGGVDEAAGELKDCAADGQVGAHLGDAQVERPDVEETPEGVAKKDRERTCFGEHSTDTDP